MFWKVRHHLEAPTMAVFNVSYNLDYRSKKDDAWYTCGVVLEDDGKLIRVKFMDLVESCNDEVFSITDLQTHDEIDSFLRRFRPVSEPIEENECSRAIEGMLVCATYKGDDESARYFDAIVDAVHYKEHTPEKCLCTYLLCWQHGPDLGNITAAKVEDICLIMHGAVDPIVAHFTKQVRGKLGQASCQSKNKIPFLSRKTNSSETLPKSQEFGSAGNGFHSGKFGEMLCPQLSDHDRDMGGVKDTGCHHYIILENLEKDLCPLLMMVFIHEHTSVTGQAFVFPSLSLETYARGAIMVDSRSNLKRIYEFMNNPNHFIVSFSGRPWVIAEDALRTGNFNTNLQSLQPKYENINTERELKVVRLGTEEYTRAKKLKDLFMEFRNHLNGLVQRLDMEEEKIHPAAAK